MSEQYLSVAENTGQPATGPIPVYQRPESIAWGAFSLFMGSSFAANTVEVVNDGLSQGNAFGGASAAAMTAFTAYNAIKAHRETGAYKNATAEERNSPRAIERRHFVRTMRTLAWGGATILCGEVAVLEAINAAEAGTTPEGLAHLGATAVSAFAGTKTVPGFFKSRREQKRLKELSAAEGPAKL